MCNKFVCSMYRFKPRSLIVVLLSAYFVMGYIVQIKGVERVLPEAQFIPLGTLIFGCGYLLIRSLVRRPFGLFPYRLRLVYVYIAVSLVLLVTANLNALRPLYSISRVMVSFGILSLSIVFFWQALRVIETSDMRCGRFLTYSLLSLLVILLLGQLTIPGWAAGIGGVRMSGGSNPNVVAFIALISIFWAHYLSLKRGVWKWSAISLYTIASIVLTWSFSRSVILTWASLYLVYFGVIGASHLARLLQERIRVDFIRKVIVIGAFCLILIPAAPTFQKAAYILQDFQKVEQRLTGESGLQSRLRAWRDIWPYFTDFPITGRAGWWNATSINSRLGGKMTADSPHNLFVRLLSESGIVGLVSVLLFPLIVMLLLLSVVIYEKVNSDIFYVCLFVLSSLLAVFLGQFFEDRFMVGVGGIGNGVIVFILCCGLLEVYNSRYYTW